MASKDPTPGNSRGFMRGISKDQEKDKEPVRTESKPAPYLYPEVDTPKTTLGMLDATRQTGEFCDIQIKLSPSHKIYAHKAILCVCSPYFKLMFTSTFMEATSNEIDLSHITENTDIVEKVINSFYGQRFEIVSSNVVEVMNLANMFFIDDLKETCGNLLKKIICLQNAAEMLQLSFNFNMPDLRRLVFHIIESRFHDYIMFQEDLVDMGAECFEYLLMIQGSFVSRKAEYICLIFDWFKRSESNERAEVAIKALTDIRPFAVSAHTYKEVETNVLKLITDLEEVYLNLAPSTRQKFIQVLKDLKPADFNSEECYESDIEKPRDLDIRMPNNRKMKFIGPRTEQEGYTKEEEEEWAQHSNDIEQLEKLEDEWKQHLAENRDKDNMITKEDPEGAAIRKNMMPIKRRHKKAQYEFKTRKLKVKTPAELEQESRLLDMVVVLAPSTEYLESDTDDTMLICGYVPRKNAWYKLGTLKAGGIDSKPSKPFSNKHQGGTRRQEGEEVEFDPEDMMDEMMFMGEMSPLYQRMPPDLPPHMIERMMMQMEQDMPFHQMRRRKPMMMRKKAQREVGSRSLLKGKWKMAYLNQTVYFYLQDDYGRVWSYDLVEQKFKEHRVGGWSIGSNSKMLVTDEALELIVMGQTLYAVVTLALQETYVDFVTRRDRSESKTRTIKTKFVIYRLTGDGMFEHFRETDSHDTYIDNTQFNRYEKPGSNSYTNDTVPTMLQGVLKCVLFREDDEKLLIFLMQRTGYRETTFRPSYILVVYLDDPRSDKFLIAPYNYHFLRELTPLVHDDVLALLNDELNFICCLNLAQPDDDSRETQFAGFSVEASSQFLESEKMYPICPVVTTNNGRFMWILNGEANDVTKLGEVRPRAHQDFLARKISKKRGVPPPVRCFSLACSGKIDRHVLRRYNPPTKYLHV